MKKGRSTGKTDRIRPGKAPGRPAYTPLATARAPKIQGDTSEICLSMFYRKCPMKRFGTERENSGEKNKKKRKEKKCMRREEKK